MTHRKGIFRLAALLLALVLTLHLPAAALTVEQARKLLEENYVDPIDPAVLALPTVQEILDALGDPYTEYLSAEDYQLFLSTIHDDLTGGIGILSNSTEDGLLVSEVAEDGPAGRAGIQVGDYLIAVDGVDIRAMDADEAVELIRGEVGTQVSVTYLRGQVRATVTLTRDTITIPSTTGFLLDGNIGYIDCTTWTEDTPDQFRSVMQSLDGHAACWMVDLRDNTGGYTNAAAETAALFCGAGPMLYLRLRDGDSADGYSYAPFGSTRAAITQKPVIILVDRYTASASEAFTAALMDSDMAVTVGERTYGKGVAQGTWDKDSDPEYFPDGDALKITVARSYSPLSNTNDRIGIIPRFPTSTENAPDIACALARAIADDPGNWREQVEEYTDGWIIDNAFEDTADSPYEWSISVLSAYSLVQGDENELFHPLGTLTRAELAQMLYNLLRCGQTGNAVSFADVSPEAWYADAVCAVAAAGFMEGTGQGRFDPERTLTCQELMTVVGRMARWLNDDLDIYLRRAQGTEWELRVLEDYADWAKPSVWLLSCAETDSSNRTVNLLWDEPECIDPTAVATREVTADLLYSILYYLNILP